MFITKLMRRQNKKTNYKLRIALLKSGLPRIVIRRSLNALKVQITQYDTSGDRVLLEETSKNLRKYGWNGHTGNTTAAYLTGLLIGLKSKQMGIKNAVADIGTQVSSKSNVMYAVVKGAKDAGIDIPSDDAILPDEKRIRGNHVVEFAAKLKSNPDLYQKQFSSCLKNNFDPEKYPEYFEKTKHSIISALGKMPKKE